MKIRTDFVTNSSSSSFITIVITMKDGREIQDQLDADGNSEQMLSFLSFLQL